MTGPGVGQAAHVGEREVRIAHHHAAEGAGEPPRGVRHRHPQPLWRALYRLMSSVVMSREDALKITPPSPFSSTRS